jgi:hypothetical protein
MQKLLGPLKIYISWHNPFKFLIEVRRRGTYIRYILVTLLGIASSDLKGLSYEIDFENVDEFW